MYDLTNLDDMLPLTPPPPVPQDLIPAPNHLTPSIHSQAIGIFL